MDGAGAAAVMGRPWTGSASAALLLLFVSLGLPWGTQQELQTDAGSGFTPQWCQVVMSPVNGFVGNWCISGASTYSSSLVSHSVVGAQHPARFGLVAAMVGLLVTGARRPALWAALVAGNVLWCGGLGFTAGGVAAAWVAVLVLLHRALRFRRGFS